MLIEWDVGVPMDDGLVLRADVFRPEGEDRAPVILTYGPYGKGLAYQDGYPDQWRILTTKHPDVLEGSTNAYQNWEAVDPERFVPAGYACIRVDSRGAGRSPGFLDPWSGRETRDIYECIEWVAVQPWCNGRVGMCGISYYAMNQWHVAGLQPPHLAAICVWEGAADFYRDTTYHGGIRCINWGNWYAMQVTNVQHGVGDRGPVSRFTGESVCGPETLSDEELAASRADFYVDVTAPTRSPTSGTEPARPGLGAGHRAAPLRRARGEQAVALHLRGNVGGIRERGVAGQVARAARRRALGVVLGRGRNGAPEAHSSGASSEGEQNGAGRVEQPRVLLNVPRVDGTFVQRGESEWPLARTRWTRFALAAGGVLEPCEPAGTDETVGVLRRARCRRRVPRRSASRGDRADRPGRAHPLPLLLDDGRRRVRDPPPVRRAG